MASITIRNIDDTIKQALRVQAALHGRSMEEQARRLLIAAVGPQSERPERQQSLTDEIEAIMQEAGGGVVLEPYPDQPINYERLDARSAMAKKP